MKRKEKNFTQLFKQAFTKKNQPIPDNQSLQDSFSADKSQFTPVVEQEDQSLKSQKIMNLLNFLCQEIRNLGEVIKAKPAEQICAPKVQKELQPQRSTRLVDLQISLQEMNLKFQKLNDGYLKNVAESISLISSKKDLQGQLEVQRSRVKELNKRHCQMLLQQQRMQCQIFLKDQRIQSYSKALSELQQQLQKALIRQSRHEFTSKERVRNESTRQSGFVQELSQIGQHQSFSLATTGIDQPILQRINLVKQIQNLTTQLSHNQLKHAKELQFKAAEIASLFQELQALTSQNQRLALELKRLLALQIHSKAHLQIQTDEWEGLSSERLSGQLKQLNERTAEGVKSLREQLEKMRREGNQPSKSEREHMQEEIKLLQSLAHYQQSNNNTLEQILLKLQSPPFSQQTNNFNQLLNQFARLFPLHSSLLQTGSLCLNHLQNMQSGIQCVQEQQQTNNQNLNNRVQDLKRLFLKIKESCSGEGKMARQNLVLRRRLKSMTRRHSSLLRKGVERWNKNHYQRLIQDALSKCKVLRHDIQQNI